jgi:transposase
MPNPTLSDVLQETAASAPDAFPPITTIAIWYDGMVDDNGQPAAIYLFDGDLPTGWTDEGAPYLDARIEPTGPDWSPPNAGQIVRFIGIPFELELPDVTTQAQPQARLTVDNVTREVMAALGDVVETGASLRVVWRLYVQGRETIGPENNPPLLFGLVDVRANAGSVSGRLTTLTAGNRAYPRRRYTIAEFPSLENL